jgi:hypothetical protein
MMLTRTDWEVAEKRALRPTSARKRLSQASSNLGELEQESESRFLDPTIFQPAENTSFTPPTWNFDFPMQRAFYFG